MINNKTPQNPIFVLTGSFDLLHRGHQNIIHQSTVLSNIFSPRPLQIITLSNVFKKRYLLEGDDKVRILKLWLQSQNLVADVHIFPYCSHQQCIDDFTKTIGVSPTSPQVLLISGIKLEDLEHEQLKNGEKNWNNDAFGEKKIFLVSDFSGSQFGSSSKIKEFLYSCSDSDEIFQDAIEQLVTLNEIDVFTATVLPKYREKLKSLYGK